MDSRPLILITGATGFIGSRTALVALNAGYRLRLVVRRSEQISHMKELFLAYVDSINFVIIPDFSLGFSQALCEDGFGKYGNNIDALEDVDFILHIASPQPGQADKKKMFEQAVDGTLSLMKAAAKSEKVRKVVITASFSTLYPLDGLPEGGTVSEESAWDLKLDPQQDFHDKTPAATALKVYRASKTLAEQAAWYFMAREKPAFKLVSIHPPCVYGHNMVQQSAAGIQGGTNEVLWNCMLNGQQGNDIPLHMVHVADVAEVHVRALRDDIASEKFLVIGKPCTWKDVAEVARQSHPEFDCKVMSTEDVVRLRTDSSKVERMLEMDWIEASVIVKEVLDQQLAFRKSKQRN